MVWPLDNKPGITSTFCEFRPSHFHAGIDIRTYHKVGGPCLAVGDGVVSYVRVSPSGYGRALFLKLDDGRTAVYAHLQRFMPQLQEMIRLRQEETEEYSVRIWLSDEEKIHVKQGDVIAYSGRSGTKHPHLHFELRDENGHLLNPLLQGLPIPDDIKPSVNAIALTPLDGSSTVEGDFQPRIYSKFNLQNGIYAIDDPIPVSGSIGVSVKEYDKANEADNFLACYGVKLIADRDTVFEFNFDSFSFEKTRQIELQRDYRLQRRGKGAYHRLYRIPGNSLNWIEGDGIIAVDHSDSVNVEIELTDAFNNLTTIKFTIVSELDSLKDSEPVGIPLLRRHETISIFDDYIRLMSPVSASEKVIDSLFKGRMILAQSSQRESVISLTMNQTEYSDSAVDLSKIIDGGESGNPILLNYVAPKETRELRSGDGKFIATIFPSSLHDTMAVMITSKNSSDFKSDNPLESMYQVQPHDQPLAGTVEVKIARENGEMVEPGWGIYYLDRKSGWTFLGADSGDGYYSAKAMSWETFGLMQDSDNPIIELISPADGDLFRSGKPTFRVNVNDETSGIISSGLTMMIDDRKVPVEYDPVIRRMIYKPWFELSEGRHTLEIIAEDRVGNISRIGRTFIIDK